MKKLSMKWIRNIIAIGLAAVFVISFGIMYIVSYVQYNDYYKKMQEIKAELNNKKDEADAGTTLTGITIAVVDGVRFFDNGKANPTKGDFVVEGQYKIADREYSEAIAASDWSLEIPEDFTQNGGTVKASYLYREEIKKEEVKTVAEVIDETDGETETEPEYKETLYTATVDIDLEAVKLERIEIVDNPYIVYYAAGDTFKPAGMTVRGYNNDGSVDERVDINTLHLETGALTVEDKKVTFSYGEGEDKITCDLIITVDSEENFDNGSLEELLLDGDLEMEEGDTINAGQMKVLARYTSGNRMVLEESEYNMTATGEDGEVYFGGKYTFKIEYNENPDIFSYVRVKVRKSANAESAYLSGGATNSDGVVANLQAGSGAKFTYNSQAASYVDLYVNVSNGNVQASGDAFVTEKYDLKNVMNLYVNDKLYYLPELSLSAAGPFDTADAAYANYTRIYLGKFWFKEGDNTVELSFKADKSGTVDFDGKTPIGRVQSVEALSFDDSRVISSIGEYVETCAETATVESYTTVQTRNWSGFVADEPSYTYSACTDNTYIYYYSRRGNANDVRLIKYNPANDTVLGWTAQFALSAEANAVTIYKGGYVYTTDSTGNFLRVATADLTTEGTAVPEATEDIPLSLGQTQGMYYNPQKRMYAALFSDKISVFDLAGNKLRDISIPSNVSVITTSGSTASASVARITGNGRFIYVMYKTNGNIAPTIRIYSFDGEFIGQTVMPNTCAIIGKPDGFWNANAQSIVDMNGEVYFSLLTWNPNQTSVYKVSFNYEFTGTENRDLGSYYEACTEAGKQIKYSAKVFDKLTGIDKYSRGMCTDGKYAYVSTGQPSGEWGDGSVRLFKVDIATNEVVGSTKIAYYRDTSTQWANADYLYYSNGKIYMPCIDGVLRYCVASDIVEKESAEWQEVDGECKINGSVVNSFTYNEALDKYAVMTRDFKLHIVNGTTFEVEKSVSVSGNQVGIYSDANYIYALHEGSSDEAKINLLNWDAELKGTITLAGVSSNVGANNVQSMFVLNDEIYLLLNAHEKGGRIIKVTLDYGVL